MCNGFKTLATEAKDQVWKNFVTGEKKTNLYKFWQLHRTDEQKVYNPNNTKLWEAQC